MRHISSIIVSAALAGCSNETRITPPLEATAQLTPAAHYDVVLLPTLGGAVTRAHSINNRGWVAGFADLPSGVRHAALWREGKITDLRTLGGSNSDVQWLGQNNSGMVVGISQTEKIDPLKESWSCAAFIPATGQTCVGFVWESGVMKPLPTLGGNNGFATGVNNRGQVVGWAETLVHDPTCDAPDQILQFRAVMWEPKKGKMQELPPFPGDSTSAATAINDKGQVVGISGECDVAVGRFSARHAVLWYNGTVTPIGNLGGVSWHTPMAINQRGDVVGFSNPKGDEDGSFIAHAFLWTKEKGIKDLGLFPGDAFSQAFSINARGQVVGRSCGAVCRAVIWQDGEMTDLKDHVAPGYPNALVAAQDINDAGVITGRAVEAGTGRALPFVATPIGGSR